MGSNGGYIGLRSVPGIDGYSGVWSMQEIADAKREGLWPKDIPKTISGLTLWFAADHLTGFNDGDAVTTWPDQSGNGYDVTQGTAGSRPLYKTNIFKGKPALLFDGTDDYFANTTSNPFTAGAARTVFGVLKSNTDTNWALLQCRTSTTYWGYSSALYSGTYMYFGDGVNGSGNTTSKSSEIVVQGTGRHIVAIRAPGAGGTHTFRLNGVNAVTTGGSTPASESGSTGFYVGRTGAIYMNGHIAELIAYDSNLSDADCLKIEKYLAIKYLDIAA